jgi:hypothetical protein
MGSNGSKTVLKIYTKTRAGQPMDRVIILSNSPGEVSGWVKPVAGHLAALHAADETLLAVLPCPYASGAEEKYGAEIDGIDRSMRFVDLWKKPPKDSRNLVLQLGGEPAFGAALSLRLHSAWMIYTSRPKWRSRVTHYFIPDANAETRFKHARIKKWQYSQVGNLILDSVPECCSTEDARKKFGLADGERSIAFLPGSRPFEYTDGSQLFCRAAQEIMSRHEEVSAFIIVAPTVDEKMLCKSLTDIGIAWKGSGKAEEVLWHGKGRIRFVREDTFDAIKASSLAVVLPGTNNLQIASIGVPMLMVAPMNRAEYFPLDGIPGLIPLSIPGAKKIKKKIVFHFNKREKYVSLPNRITDEPIVPEHRYIMTPSTIAHLAEELLYDEDRLKEITDGYAKIKFEYGASKKIADTVKEYFEKENQYLAAEEEIDEIKEEEEEEDPLE